MKYSLLVIFILSYFISGCSSNPVIGSKEPLEAAQFCTEQVPEPFLPDGHLYTTLSLTDIAEYDDLRKMTITYYSQYPDIDPDFEAVPVSFKYLFIPWKWDWRNDITGTLHSLHGGDRKAIDQRRENIQSALSQSLEDPNLDWLSGLIIHAYGDSYAHTKNEFNSENEKAYNVWIGHAIPTIFGSSPDDIKKENNEPKYLGYISSLYRTIKLNDGHDERFIEFKNFVDKLDCEGGECPNFHALFTSNEENRIDKFTSCMNENSRPLKVSEINLAMSMIFGNTDKK